MQVLYHIGTEFLALWLDAAFWLVLGLIVAGLLRSFLNSNNIGRHLQGKGLWPAIKAALLGTPIPLCSCGVIPAAVGLRRAGASKSATTAFLISTPETGIDSIAISYALLGPFMAIIRPIAALCSAIAAAALVLLGDDRPHTTTVHAVTPLPKSSESKGCGCSSSCCPSKTRESTHHTANAGSLYKKLIKGQYFAFTELVEDLSVWLVVGLVISAIVVTFVPYDALAAITQGPAAMLIMALVGIPMYICASASTPLAAGLMLAGVSPGAILVFLLAGPATNIATLGIVRKELGKHALFSYLSGVIAVAICFGYLTNYLIAHWHINIQSELASSNEVIPEFMTWITAIFLGVIIIKSLYDKLHHSLFATTNSHGNGHHHH